MTIIYNIDGNEINLFNDDFIKNNKDNCYLLIEGKKESLCSYWKLNKTDKKLLEIKLIETKTITDMSYMFYDCNSLKNLPDISKWDTKNVNNMSYMFYDCNSLNNLPDISKWDTKNVTNMICMFFGCDEKIIPEKFK